MSARRKIAIWLLASVLGWVIIIGTGFALAATARFVWGELA